VVAISTAIVAIRTFEVSERTLQSNTRQQISDRFVKVIEQLGNDKSPDVRIGGIYGLEQPLGAWKPKPKRFSKCGCSSSGRCYREARS
jgi:hypothetical protein